MSGRWSAEADINQMAIGQLATMGKQQRWYRSDNTCGSLIKKGEGRWRRNIFHSHIGAILLLFAVYQNTGCSMDCVILTTVSSPIQTSCGLWGRYTVSPSATWPCKECLTMGRGGEGSLTPARGTSWQTTVTTEPKAGGKNQETEEDKKNDRW